MTNEEKSLLLIDLCARLPYGVIASIRKPFGCVFSREEKELTIDDIKDFIENDEVRIFPYLRPMSSITTDEKMEWFNMRQNHCGMSGFNAIQERADFTSESLDWLNAHHFDYRGLIEKGLALEASEDMYKTE
jgi:hypothetical protein